MERSLFEKILEQLDDPQWLLEFRRDAFAAYEQIPWSDIDREQWKIVQPSQGIESANKLLKNSLTSNKTSVSKSSKTAKQSGWDVSVTGCSGLSKAKESLKGVTSGSIRELAHSSSHSTLEILKKNLWLALEQNYSDKWWLLSCALFEKGVLVDVQPRIATQAIRIETRVASHERPLFSLNLVHVGAQAEVDLVETYESRDQGESFLVSSTILNADDHAKVKRMYLQDLAPQSHALFFNLTTLGRKTENTMTLLSLGGKTTRYEHKTYLDGEEAVSNQTGVNFSAQDQMMDMNLIQTHLVPSTKSELLVRSVLGDSSKTAFNGNIIIDPAAHHTEAGQTNYNLLLSRKAQALSLPKLEIGTDDVQCHHGATVSSLDDEQLFYLMSRGFSREAATRILVQGFFTDVLQQIPEGPMRERCEMELDRKLDRVVVQ